MRSPGTSLEYTLLIKKAFLGVGGDYRLEINNNNYYKKILYNIKKYIYNMKKK